MVAIKANGTGNDNQEAARKAVHRTGQVVDHRGSQTVGHRVVNRAKTARPGAPPVPEKGNHHREVLVAPAGRQDSPRVPPAMTRINRK